MDMRRNELDMFCMLLSTDWFFRHWPAIGVSISRSGGIVLRDGLREIVNQILSGADQYWLASFAPERTRETWAMLERLLEKAKIDPRVASQVRDLALGHPSAMVDYTTAWLLVSITRMMCDNSLGDQVSALKPALRGIMIQAYSTIKHDSLDLETDNLQSGSQWDRYVRNLTPDLPTYLSDYASSDLLKGREFEAFWNAVRASATVAALRELVNWYASVATVLTGEDVELPMDQLAGR
jgi:hypothetical protein